MARQTHSHWGLVATPADLFNVAGSSNNSPNLSVGDQAFSLSDTTTYQCTDSTAGAAVWTAMGGGGGAGSYLDWGQKDYMESSPVVEEVIGSGAFNGSLIGSLTCYFRATIEPVVSNPGDEMYVILYEMGPRDGPLSALPREVARLTTVGSGLQYLSTVLTTNPSPGPGEIYEDEMLYETVITSNATTGDTAKVLCGLDIREADLP